jgi:hypothetical protein
MSALCGSELQKGHAKGLDLVALRACLSTQATHLSRQSLVAHQQVVLGVLLPLPLALSFSLARVVECLVSHGKYLG